MRAYEFINEIVYSSSISDSNHILNNLKPTIDTNVGIVDHHPVYIKDGGNCIVFYITNQNNEIQGYILVEKNKLNNYYVFRQAEKVSSTHGIMMALIQFLTTNNVKLVIRNDEPMTINGLKWISGIINNPRGLNVHDGNNNPVNLKTLHDEWSDSLDNPGKIGKISIYIESFSNDITKKHYCFEDQRKLKGLLKNHLRFVGDEVLP